MGHYDEQIDARERQMKATSNTLGANAPIPECRLSDVMAQMCDVENMTRELVASMGLLLQELDPARIATMSSKTGAVEVAENGRVAVMQGMVNRSAYLLHEAHGIANNLRALLLN